MTAAMYVPRFTVKQRYAFTANQYEILVPDGTGTPQLMAYAQQKRMAFKEEVTFYTDPSKSRKVFSFKARQVMDLGAGYDVFDEHGQPLGLFRRSFTASIFRTTFEIEGPGFAGAGQERNPVVAVIRRFTDVDFLPVHFDFTDREGRPLLSSTREMTLRDQYAIEVPDQRVDFRLAAAVAVGLDALMAR